MNRPLNVGGFFLINMKYRQLTKEQLEELHQEFATFLASQQIDVKEWKIIKETKPEVAEEEINIFSDMVWEDVLTKVHYLEHISENHINLFKCNSKEIIRIYIKMNAENMSFLNSDDFQKFINEPLANDYSFYKAVKKYSNARNSELFELIEMGGQITNGKLFKALIQIIS